MSYESVGKGIVKRTERRTLGLFIDGTGLDRASRRINRKVDMSALVRGVTSGLSPSVARYYTLIPNEDDSRQRAFLEAVSRAGLTVIVKRLPPKGITRQVSVDIEMAADIVAFSLGHQKFGMLNQYVSPEQEGRIGAEQSNRLDGLPAANASNQTGREEKRIITVVCPSRDLAYPISLAKELGADTVTADFGQFKSSDILKSAAKWIDLSDSETIWRE